MEHCDFAAIEALLRRHGFHFSKSMGQNFLIDATVPAAIAEASEAGEGNGVLEIGPGIGALSHELCRRAGRVVAVELDKALLPILDETMANFDNFEVVSADILKTDIPALVHEKLAGLTPIVCYDGLVGPGTGTFMILGFTALLSLDLITAGGCAKASNLASCAASAVVWILHGQVLWALAIPALACSIAGNYLGALYAIRGGSKKIRSVMFLVLGLLFVKMLYELLF